MQLLLTPRGVRLASSLSVAALPISASRAGSLAAIPLATAADTSPDVIAATSVFFARSAAARLPLTM